MTADEVLELPSVKPYEGAWALGHERCRFGDPIEMPPLFSGTVLVAVACKPGATITAPIMWRMESESGDLIEVDQIDCRRSAPGAHPHRLVVKRHPQIELGARYLVSHNRWLTCVRLTGETAELEAE